MTVTDEARARLRTTGSRVTPARVRVLAILLDARRALSHHDIEAALDHEHDAVDRVTLYRVLDWLVAQELAHRVAGGDRVWRYSIARDAHAEHAHFQCNGCGRVFCLAELAAARIPLPRGYRSESVELTVKGRCAECSA